MIETNGALPLSFILPMTLEDLNENRLNFYNKAHRLTFNYYLRQGRVPEVLRKIMEETSSMAKFMDYLGYSEKDNPYHKPAGTPEGGQFDFAPGGARTGSGGSDQSRGGDSSPPSDREFFRNFPSDDYVEPGLGHPPSPIDILLARKPVISFFGSVFRQSAGQQYYTLQDQRYSSHALDQMEARGIPPSVVKNALRQGARNLSHGNTTIFYDKENNVTVVIGNKSKQVVTVRRGKP